MPSLDRAGSGRVGVDMCVKSTKTAHECIERERERGEEKKRKTGCTRFGRSPPISRAIVCQWRWSPSLDACFPLGASGRCDCTTSISIFVLSPLHLSLSLWILSLILGGASPARLGSQASMDEICQPCISESVFYLYSVQPGLARVDRCMLSLISSPL